MWSCRAKVISSNVTHPTQPSDMFGKEGLAEVGDRGIVKNLITGEVKSLVRKRK